MSGIETVCLLINMVKYDANQEIMNSYENLQLVRSQFLTNKLVFIYIIYWFIGIQIRSQWIHTNSYLVTLDYS